MGRNLGASMSETVERMESADPYERLALWARRSDLDAWEARVAEAMPLPELDSEWSVSPALRVGPGRLWENCRKIIRAFDAELIEIDARAQLRQLEAEPGESQGGDRARRLREGLGALRDLREAERMDRLWEAAREEMRSGAGSLREWIVAPGRAGLEERFDAALSLAESPWPRARAAAGWALDGLRADPGRSAEALSVLEREALELAAASGQGESSEGRL